MPCRPVDIHMGLNGGDGADLEKSSIAGRKLQTLAVGFCPQVGFCYEGPPVNALCPHPQHCLSHMDTMAMGSGSMESNAVAHQIWDVSAFGAVHTTLRVLPMPSSILAPGHETEADMGWALASAGQPRKAPVWAFP